MNTSLRWKISIVLFIASATSIIAMIFFREDRRGATFVDNFYIPLPIFLSSVGVVLFASMGGVLGGWTYVSERFPVDRKGALIPSVIGRVLFSLVSGTFFGIIAFAILVGLIAALEKGL